MSTFFIKLKTLYLLGLLNVFRVFFYRFKLKSGLSSVCHLQAAPPIGPFFLLSNTTQQLRTEEPSNWQHEALYFGWWKYPISDLPPVWHQNPFNLLRTATDKPWWKISDFDTQVGDIKLIWEASRFSWLLTFVQQIRNGDQGKLIQLNNWLADWCEKNPPFLGVNWKCGQEAAIRVMHLGMAWLILESKNTPPPALIELIKIHLQRIEPTIQYALSQDNNHGTSEAAALFIGGHWLESMGKADGKQWARKGRHWLENRVKRLIEKDGSFSQYSVNYHRVLLDTLCMVEIWRRQFSLSEFTTTYNSRITAAINWLACMVDPETGDAPLLGSYDGARLLPLTNGDERDFRPTVQLAMALFTYRRAYAGEGHWNIPLVLFEIPMPKVLQCKVTNQNFIDGGLAVLHSGPTMALLRYPKYRFRPCQADALHVDLWKDGENLLRDAGTYSYHTDERWINYFSGTESHNTIQFDDRDQMPRLGRFLFGDWLKTEWSQEITSTSDHLSFGASYRDRRGVCHKRCIFLKERGLEVTDEISGFSHKAILRWRLSPGQWSLKESTISNGSHILRIDSTMPIKRIELVTSWESRYYMKKTEVPGVEVEFNEPGLIFSKYDWVL